MADGILYKDAILTTTVKKSFDGVTNYYGLDLPFRIYGQDIVQNGSMVTYELEKHDKEEVLAKIDYLASDDSAVKALSSYLGADPESSSKYISLWTSKKPLNAKQEFCVAISLNNVEVKI